MNLKSAISWILPTIATALGGPAAGGAVRFLADKFLGDENASVADLESAISKANPDQLIQLKQIDADYKSEMARADVNLEQIMSDDRNSARNREVVLKDYMPKVLALLLTLGFFGFLTGMFLMPGSFKNPALDIMLGMLSTKFGEMISYYFGSSKGSADKNRFLSKHH